MKTLNLSEPKHLLLLTKATALNQRSIKVCYTDIGHSIENKTILIKINLN